MAWEVDPSRMTPLAPWDPKYEAKAGPQPVWVSCEGKPVGLAGVFRELRGGLRLQWSVLLTLGGQL